MISVLEHDRALLFHGDSARVGEVLPPESVDALITDPPYELGFMGKSWDSTGIAFNPDFWKRALAVLKPGAHALIFGGSRTYHRIACAVEDAGFELRDCIMWMYGTGFPKSLNVSKAIAGVDDMFAQVMADDWKGWGTALKPAYEPVIVARKPLAGTVAANVLKHGTGAINVDACRIAGSVGVPGSVRADRHFDPNTSRDGVQLQAAPEPNAAGRWPANVILDEEASAALDEMSGIAAPKASRTGKKGGCSGALGHFGGSSPDAIGHWPEDPGGGASRFFYCAKASRSERDEGCANLPPKSGGEATDREDGSAGTNSPRAGAGRTGGARNFHPTVKPQALMRYLCRLVTPPGGTVLDLFTGSGSTGVAALAEGFNFVGFELTEEYLPIIEARLEHALAGKEDAS